MIGLKAEQYCIKKLKIGKCKASEILRFFHGHSIPKAIILPLLSDIKDILPYIVVCHNIFAMKAVALHNGMAAHIHSGTLFFFRTI